MPPAAMAENLKVASIIRMVWSSAEVIARQYYLMRRFSVNNRTLSCSFVQFPISIAGIASALSKRVFQTRHKFLLVFLDFLFPDDRLD